MPKRGFMVISQTMTMLMVFGIMTVFLFIYTVGMYFYLTAKFSRMQITYMELMAEDYAEQLVSIFVNFQEVTQKTRTNGQSADEIHIGPHRYKRSGNVPYSLRFRVMQRDKFACRLCGKKKSDGIKLEVDHRMPVSRGGTNEPKNLWTLCHICNNGKSNKIVEPIVNFEI
jgi:hypothetical protein